MVQFEDFEARAKVIEAGPWYFDNKPVIVKPWSATVSPERDRLSSDPIWIKLPGLRLHLWVAPMISELASVVGRPLYTYMMTSNRSRLAYARLCVEIGLEAELPKVIIIRDPNGGLIEQYVEYEWVLMQCKVCHVYQEAKIEASLEDKGGGN